MRHAADGPTRLDWAQVCAAATYAALTFAALFWLFDAPVWAAALVAVTAGLVGFVRGYGP